MGRELKRVSPDFSWPHKRIWPGYLNPWLPVACKVCEHSGYNSPTLELDREWYAFHMPHGHFESWCYNLDQADVNALLEAKRLGEFSEKALSQNSTNSLTSPTDYIPTAQEVNAWARTGLGHDEVNRYVCVKAKATRLDFYGLCPECQGAGQMWLRQQDKVLYEEWKPYNPPSGEGYQLWETTTEGSPISPVFASLTGLCQWCETNATTFGDYKVSSDAWHKFLSVE